MNYLSYFLIFNFALLSIYGIVAYRFRTFRLVKFRFSGFLVVKLLIRFCLINLFIYLLFQFSTFKNSLNAIRADDFQAVLVLDQSFSKTYNEANFSIFSDQIPDNKSSYSLFIYEKGGQGLKLLIPKTSFLSFLTYLRNKDLKNAKMVNREDVLFIGGIQDKKEGFYVQSTLGNWEQISTGSFSQKQEYFGFDSTLDLYLLILLSILLLSEVFLSFQIIKY